MGRLAIIVSAAALMLGSMVLANAQTQQPGASSLQGQAQNATPFKQAGCIGWGGGCRPGWRRVCGPYRCWCHVC